MSTVLSLSLTRASQEPYSTFFNFSNKMTARPWADVGPARPKAGADPTTLLSTFPSKCQPGPRVVFFNLSKKRPGKARAHRPESFPTFAWKYWAALLLHVFFQLFQQNDGPTMGRCGLMSGRPGPTDLPPFHGNTGPTRPHIFQPFHRNASPARSASHVFLPFQEKARLTPEPTGPRVFPLLHGNTGLHFYTTFVICFPPGSPARKFFHISTGSAGLHFHSRKIEPGLVGPE